MREKKRDREREREPQENVRKDKDGPAGEKPGVLVSMPVGLQKGSHLALAGGTRFLRNLGARGAGLGHAALLDLKNPQR